MGPYVPLAIMATTAKARAIALGKSVSSAPSQAPVRFLVIPEHGVRPALRVVLSTLIPVLAIPISLQHALLLAPPVRSLQIALRAPVLPIPRRVTVIALFFASPRTPPLAPIPIHVPPSVAVICPFAFVIEETFAAFFDFTTLSSHSALRDFCCGLSYAT